MFSSRGSCWCHCEPSWYCTPVCCSDSFDSPDRRLCQKHVCHCICRPCSACLYSAESQWIDGRTAHEHISLSAQNLWEEKIIWLRFKTWDTDEHILLWIERLWSSLIRVSDHYLWIDFIIAKVWHLSDSPPVTSFKKSLIMSDAGLLWRPFLWVDSCSLEAAQLSGMDRAEEGTCC